MIKIREIRIEINVFNPFILVFEEKYKDLIKKLFFTMLEDIMQSDVCINLDNKTVKMDCKLKNIKKDKKRIFDRRYKILELCYQIELNEIFEYEDICDNQGNKLDEEQIYALKESLLISENEKFIMDFTFALNLAYPGLFEFECAKIFVDNIEEKKARLPVTLVDWVECYIDYKKNNWPEIHILKFTKVWKWLNEKTNYISDGMSKTPIERALNALSYTLGECGYEEIFYILIGLEAIYNDNKNVGITEQLKTKTEILLKRPLEFKKKISKFYGNRSEFLHGDMNFPNKYYMYDAAKEFEDFYFNKYIETVTNAKAILLSTVQEFIIQNANQLKIKMDIELL